MVVGLSRNKHSHRKSKYIQSQDLFQQYKQRAKNYSKVTKTKTRTTTPSLSSAKATFKPLPASAPHSPTTAPTVKPPKTDKSEGNLLQQYKHYQNYADLPSNRDVKWSNFIQGLDELPPELSIEFINELDRLRDMYGDEAVAYYLDKRSLLSDINQFSNINYKSFIALSYLYQLARGIELALDYGMNEAHEDLKAELETSIDTVKSPYMKELLTERLSDTTIQNHNLTMALDEYLDSLWDEMD